MKFRLIIDESREEEVTAVVHGRSSLTDQIEALVVRYCGADRLAAYREDGMKLLRVAEVSALASHRKFYRRYQLKGNTHGNILPPIMKPPAVDRVLSRDLPSMATHSCPYIIQLLLS